MRLGLSVLMLAVFSCLTTSTYSQEQAAPLTSVESVKSVKSELFTQYSALDDAKRQIVDKKNELNKQKNHLAKLSQQEKLAKRKFTRSKAQLAEDYAKLVNTPDYDIAPSQLAYQKAWNDLKIDQGEVLNAKQKEQDLKDQLAQRKQNKQQIELNISTLQQTIQRQRVVLLRAEISQGGSETVSFVNTCKSAMTLDECAKQSATLALQKAVREFQSHLINSATESALIKQNERSASLNIHVLKYEKNRAEFFGENKFKTVLDVSLLAKPAKNAPCKLLNLDSQFCFFPGQDSESKPAQKEIAWFSVTVYSNKYQDKVTIDGVGYGSTPIEIMLSRGMHTITVEKEGYKTFQQKIRINSDQSIRTTLIENENVAQAGAQFADLIDKQIKAPPMSVITRGLYQVGENAGQKLSLTHDYSISSSPITVQQFTAFVTETAYKTDAERHQECSAVEQANITPMAGQYWRDPGFKQSNDFPVVCISQNDAAAYAKWLTRKTGFYYRLPTEDEWEIAARGGSTSNYWWGNEFDSGHANTGWGGTSWSNISTSPVGTFAANQFGLFDAVGNVWEWTSGARGMLKGGAWSFSPEKAKAGSELFVAPEFSGNFTGFRVVREL